MAGTTLEDIQNLPDPAPLWRHRVEMPTDIPGVTRPEPQQIIGGSFSWAFADADQRAHSGSYVYYPQFNNIDAIDIIFFETADYQIIKYLTAWFNLVVSGKDGTYSASDIYKRNIILRMNDNADNETIRVRYNGTWPTRINHIELSENEEYFQVSCNFSVDSNNVEFDGLEQSGVGGITSALRSNRNVNGLPWLREVNARIGQSGPLGQLTKEITQRLRTGNPTIDRLIGSQARALLGGQVPTRQSLLREATSRISTGNPRLDGLVRAAARGGSRGSIQQAVLNEASRSFIPSTGSSAVDNLIRNNVRRGIL